VPILNFTEVTVCDEVSIWLKNKKNKNAFLHGRG